MEVTQKVAHQCNSYLVCTTLDIQVDKKKKGKRMSTASSAAEVAINNFLKLLKFRTISGEGPSGSYQAACFC
jgi:hypothetical protein